MVKARYRIYSSAILSASIDQAWREMRDFGKALKIAFSDDVTDIKWVEGGSVEHIPSRIEFKLQPSGVTVMEELVGRSEVDRSLKYRSVGIALSMVDYVGTFDFYLITDEPDKTFLATTKEFSLTDSTDVSGFLGGYEALVHQETRNIKAYFAKR